jgi:hypothetical protein
MMKYLQHLLVLSGAIVIFFSCQKEYSVENNGPGTNIGASQWQFKDSTGALLKGPVDTAYIDSVGPLKYLTVEGVSDDGRDFITLQVFGTTIAPGAYKLPNSMFDYIRSGVSIYQSDAAVAPDFTVNITAIDTAGVTGTFSGKVKDANNVVRTITEGKFAGKFKKSNVVVPPPVTDSGQVMLWSKAGCGGGTSTTPIAVSISNKTGQITSFTATEPTACGVAGMFTVKLLVGSYTWKAKCGADSISGTVAVTKNGCTKAEVNFAAPPPTGDYFPTTFFSNWSYIYVYAGSPPDDTAYTLSNNTTKIFGPNTYNLFTTQYDPNSKDTVYYRKGSGIYYEYYSAEQNYFGFDNNVAVEHVILKDNVTAGTVWEASYNGIFQSVPVAVKISDTLKTKLPSFTVGATTYQDVLEVRTGYYGVFPAPVGTQQLLAVRQWFARGVGLIKYYQLDINNNSEYTTNITRFKVF